MRPEDTENDFRARLADQGLELATLTVQQGVDAMLAFYADERCEGCDLESDGDMLLYQWGYSKQKRTYELDITRQFMSQGGEDEDILQLSLTFHFDADPKLGAIPGGDEWCASLGSLESFRGFIAGSAAFAALRERLPTAVSLRLDGV